MTVQYAPLSRSGDHRMGPVDRLWVSPYGLVASTTGRLQKVYYGLR